MIDYKFILVIIIAYFLGNISPSTIQAKKNGVDIKQEGSGNAGTTNAFRVLGAKAALITLLVDVGKGVLAVFIGDIFSTHVASSFPDGIPVGTQKGNDPGQNRQRKLAAAQKLAGFQFRQFAAQKDVCARMNMLEPLPPAVFQAIVSRTQPRTAQAGQQDFQLTLG